MKTKDPNHQAKAPRKQTLLDSFVTRVPSKTAPVEGDIPPPANTDLQLGRSSNRIAVSLEEEPLDPSSSPYLCHIAYSI